MTTDTHHYISEESNRLIDQLEPSDKVDVDARRAKYAAIHDWIMDNKGSLYCGGRTAERIVHNGPCPVFGRVAAQLAEEHGPWDESRPLFLNSAGTICKDWSAVGKREGLAGKSERTHSIWLGERSAAAEAGVEDFPSAHSSTRFSRSWLSRSEGHTRSCR